MLSQASAFLNSSLDCLSDSLWFEAGENLDSALNRLSLLDSLDTLDAATRISSNALKDTVQALMMRIADVSGEIEEVNPIAELTDKEIEETGDSAQHAFDNLANSLDYELYDLPLPNPLPARVQKALAYFTGPGRKVYARWLNRKPRYEPYVKERLVARGMPKDLFYLAMIESGLNPRAYSHARAAGMWQFISGTGRRYGLMDDYWIDPRRDIVAATDAALSYLQTLFNEFGDWHLAMAAYNCGENRIRRQLRADSTQNYWDMKLPAETEFYVPKVLAAMILGHEPGRFGFTVDDPQAPLAFDTITVTDCLPLVDVAKAVDATEEEIIDLNPSLRRWCTPPNRKSHVLYLPPGKRGQFAEAYAKMDKQKLLSWKQHHVARGENLGLIANKYGISVSALMSANQLKSSRLRVGQNLIIPVPSSGGGSGEFEAEVLREAATPKRKQLEMTYRVRQGDNLFDISRRFKTSVDKLRSTNGLDRKGTIFVGQILKISKSQANASAEPETQAGRPLPASNRQYHEVLRGETLYGLSRSLGVDQNDLIRWNDLEGKELKAGTRLVYASDHGGSQQASAAKSNPNLSGSPARVHEVARGENPYAISRQYGVELSDLLELNGLTPQSSIRPGDTLKLPADASPKGDSGDAGPEQYYIVREGDTLWDISQRFKSSVSALKEMNQTLSKVLKPGTKIRVR